MSDSRTSNTIKNSITALLFYFLNMLLGLVSRQVFFDKLGSEILGLNSTAGNIFGMLNLTELGIGSAIGYFLYKPLYDKDENTICEIVSLQGWLYRKIALIVIGLSAIVMSFFPWIFAKSPLPLWYAYATFAVFIVGSMQSYFLNYKTVIIGAAQKGYKLQTIYQTSGIIKIILEIIAISYSKYPYIVWLVVELGMTIAQTLLLQLLVRRDYPWLKTNMSQGKELFYKYIDIWKKTKQIFVHRIAYTVIGQTSNIVIYGFSSLSVVALYGNYTLVVGKVINLIRAFFDGAAASVGNLVASGDKKNIQRVFWELFDTRFFFAIVAVISVYFMTEPFIMLWLGEQYLLGKTFVVIYVLYNSIYMVRTTVDHFLAAYGLYQDVWAAGAEAILHLGLSCLFGYFWGLNGIIFGIFICNVIIISLWKPYFLFHKGFKISPLEYFIPIIKRYLFLSLMFFVMWYIFDGSKIIEPQSWKEFIMDSAIVGSTCCVLTYIPYCICSSGLRDFSTRMLKIIFNKGRGNM
ncbi:MAG: sugar transporter [Bacteroidales bacterium]|nr:sugar transporter [Bacteroidales bacterium]MCM1147026.1 sugar transporter [Bacteroidales bacterium]MCM1205841.1 sugar transporter [Bacillota bacterium]MCM1509917.1 hypothetical protein [Clostridium sp.]